MTKQEEEMMEYMCLVTERHQDMGFLILLPEYQSDTICIDFKLIKLQANKNLSRDHSFSNKHK